VSEEEVPAPAESLLTDDEQRDLACVIDRAGIRWRATADVGDLQHQLERVYVEGRLSGLCREGALELVSDALSSLPGSAEHL
jgi:hypothetical protein